MLARKLAIVPLLCSALACSDSTGPEIRVCTLGTVFESTLVDGVRLFTWNGGCGIDGLAVLDFGEKVVWAIRSKHRNQLLSPIRYGVVPSNARELVSPREMAGHYVFFMISETGVIIPF